MTITSAWKVCGSSSIDQIMGKRTHPIKPVKLDTRVAISLPEKLRAGQRVLRRTGDIHAADKVIGSLLLNNRLPAPELSPIMSSRASFELVQKTVIAGLLTLVAVSAASSLAVDMAREAGLALTAFTRHERFKLSSGPLKPAPQATFSQLR